MNGRERILAMIEGQPTDCLPAMPITMTFASRLLGVNYREYCTDYKVHAEGQVRVATEFDIDYVSAISDPAVESTDCGSQTVWYDDDPPANNETQALLTDKTKLDSLAIPVIKAGTRMMNRVNCIAELKRCIGHEKAVEGWIEGPAAEGADLRGINNLMLDFYDDPNFVEKLFEFVLAMELKFAAAQVAAGADIIGIGDAAASLVGPQIYNEIVWPFEKKMVEGVQKLGAKARLHICGNTRRILAGMGTLGCGIVDLDYFSSLEEGRRAMGKSQVLLGNIDPVRVLRNGTPEQVRDAIEECHLHAGARYIVGAGCEVVRDTPHDNLRALIEYAKTH
jgi:MtaA/CmuA family methyltransferase